MKLFIDSADVAEVEALAKTGLIDGVTTNPSLIARSGQGMVETIRKLCALVEGPVSAEVTATKMPEMLREGKLLAQIASNIAVKVPLTEEGLLCCRALRAEKIAVNVTLCFSAAQALLVAKAGATFVSPFIGRLDDIGQDGLQLIETIAEIYSHYGYSTQILTASVRSAEHVVEAARLGAHVATIPPKVFRSLYKHPLTDIGLASFLADWKKTGQSIL